MAITEKQREKSDRLVGGTAATVITGVNQFTSRPQLWLKMTGRTPHTPPDENTLKAMEFGTRVEPVVCTAVEEQLGIKLIECDTVTHPKHKFLIGHPDRLVKGKMNGKRVGVEIKTCGIFRKHTWEDAAGKTIVPSSHVVQCAHYMMVTGYDEWIIACLVHGVKWDMRIATIKRDKELEEMILDAEVDFWNTYVKGDKEPPFENDPRALEYLRARYPRSVGKILVADNETAQKLLTNLEAAKTELAIYEERFDKAKADVMGYMQDAALLQWQDRNMQVSWKSGKEKETVDWEKLAEDLLGRCPKAMQKKLLAKYTDTQPGSRRFLMSFKEQK